MAELLWMWVVFAQLTSVAAVVSCFDGKGSFTKTHWPFCQKVHESVLVYYGPSADANYLKLGLYADGHSGWSALALAGNGGMKGAQQFVVRKEGDVWVGEERYSTDYATPQLQEVQNVELVFASDEGGSTSWGLVIPMTSCAAGERYPIEDVSRWMHWALGDSHRFTYHTKRGQFHANLISGPMQTPDLSSSKEVDLRMPNVSVVLGQGGTDATNPYICGIFDLAELLPSGMNVNDKHHVVKFAPYLNPSSEKYVHHMILYSCNIGVENGMSFTHKQVVGECESMPQGCYQLKWPWAVGSEDVVFPADVGMPFGQTNRWLALQMHYYNPSLDVVKDSSGVKLFFGDSVRTYDAAVFEVNGGTGPDMRDPLPAAQEDVILPSMVVPQQCTNQWDVPSVKILGAVYHGHLVGKSFNIDVTNNGRYVGMLRREKRYDFNHQSLEPASLKTISRGDELTFTCRYDTSQRAAPTSFGDLTQQEMCWSAFMYYPAQTMTAAYFLGAQGNKRWTRCAGMDRVEQFIAPEVIPPTCMPKGNLSSAAAWDLLQRLRDNRSTMMSTTTISTTTTGNNFLGEVSSTTIRAVDCSIQAWMLLIVCAARVGVSFV